MMGTGQVRKDQERSRPKVKKRLPSRGLKYQRLRSHLALSEKGSLFWLLFSLFLLLFIDPITFFSTIYESHSIISVRF